VQELLCYLLVHRAIPHQREFLASMLWGDNSTAQSKKYLRQALWQLHSACETYVGKSNGSLILVGPEWIQVNPEIELWTDVSDFEQAFDSLRNGGELNEQCALQLSNAVKIYRGDLLEGWYKDWCLYDRERLQNMCLIMLDKLIEYCEKIKDYESALDYCSRILHFDPARERTHQQMMQLYYLSGDRTAALRQFDRCLEALKKELGVGPTRSSIALCEQIRADKFVCSSPNTSQPVDKSLTSLTDLLNHLKHLQAKYTEIQLELQEDIQIVEQLFSRTTDRD
jgi:DNA-binding SARP family transcriptional activator